VGNLAASDDPLSAAAGDRAYSGTLIRHAGRNPHGHDAQGRLTRRRHRTLSGQVREWTYSWDAEDRLTAVTTPDGHHWRYRYDAIGRRIGKWRLDSQGTVLERIDFAWDGALLAEQFHTSEGQLGRPSQTTTWDYRPGTFDPLAQTERVHPADGSQRWIDQQFHAIVTDITAAPCEMVDESGNVIRQAHTTLWGYDTPTTADRAYCPLRFPGQYFDPETQLHYNFHRYYDPVTGRYSTPDPLGLAAGPNPYVYVENPKIWIDPFGLEGCESDLPPARAAAKQVADAASSIRPSAARPAVAEAIHLPNGKTFASTSVRGATARMHPAVQAVLKTVAPSVRGVGHGQCGLAVSLSQALFKGESPMGADAAAVLIRGSLDHAKHGFPVGPCDSCKVLAEHFNLNFLT
jgi:RHS repeat-associated protein